MSVSELVRLAQVELAGESTRKDAGFGAVTARLWATRQRKIKLRALRSALLATSALVGVLALVWLLLPAPALTYRVDNGSAESDRVVGGSGTRVRFSDGSELALERGAETRIQSLGAKGGLVRVERGGARVAIAKKAGAAWTIQAGPYSIEVTGTSFDVRWSASEQRFELAMHSGSVIVKGPLAGAGLPLRAGQRLIGAERE